MITLQVTANEYMCPDFFLACYFCIHGEPELCDYVLDSAKAQAERAAINKRAAEAKLQKLKHRTPVHILNASHLFAVAT